MMKELLTLKIPQKLIKLVEMTIHDTKAKVRFQETTTEEFEIKKGVKQGDPLSPSLFNLVLESIIRKVKLDKRNIITDDIQIIAYADDLTIVANSRHKLIKAIEKIEEEARHFGMDINQNKTKHMKIGREEGNKHTYLTTQNHKFETVTSFNFLGTTIEQAGKEQFTERILKGNQAYGRNKNLLKSKTISKNTKIKIYRTLIRPVLTYALETATINKKEEENLKVAERKIMRTILGPNITANGERRLKTNKEIENELKGETITRYIKAQRLKWAGHIMRRTPMEMIRRITQWTPLGPKKRGRPKIRWLDQVEEDTHTMGVTDWKMKCKDRTEWRKITTEARTHKKL